jgi:hypothetical protein
MPNVTFCRILRWLPECNLVAQHLNWD